MITREQHLLIILAEECNEVAQRAIKSVRCGSHEQQDEGYPDNADRLAEELDDLAAVVQMLRDEGTAIGPEILLRTWRKRAKVERYLKYSIEKGTTEGDSET